MKEYIKTLPYWTILLWTFLMILWACIMYWFNYYKYIPVLSQQSQDYRDIAKNYMKCKQNIENLYKSDDRYIQIKQNVDSLKKDYPFVLDK